MSDSIVGAAEVSAAEVMAVEAVGISETIEAVDAVIDLANLGLAIGKDKKVDVMDLPVLMAAIPGLAVSIPKALAGVNKIPGELGDLSTEEGESLIGHAMGKLSVGDGKAKRVVIAALKAAAADYELVKELLSKDA